MQSPYKKAKLDNLCTIFANPTKYDNSYVQSKMIQFIFLTSLIEAIVLMWLNPRSRCFSFVHFRILSTFANLFRLRSRVSTAGRSCNDSSIRTNPLQAHDTKDNWFHCGDSFISAILPAKTWRRASWNIPKK